MSQSKPLLQGNASPSYDGQVDEEQPADTIEKSKGFADGYNNWSNTFGAFEVAIWHGVVYVFLGILFYSFILQTKLSVIQSVYFAVSVFTTVGYGDISPADTNAGMIFTIFYSMYGIVILGIFLGVLGDFAVQRQHKLYKKVRNAATEKYLESIESKTGKATETNAEEEEEEEVDVVYEFLETHDKFIGDIYKAAKDQKYLLILMVILAVPMIVIEKWSLIQGLYWLAITGTTIGLGDQHPDSKYAQFYCITYIPFAVALVGRFVGNISTSYVDNRNIQAEEDFLNQALTESSLEKMDRNNDNEVSKAEFLVFMLKTMGKADKREMERILNIFDKLDKDGSGTLTKEDIQFIPDHTAKIHKTLAKKKKS